MNTLNYSPEAVQTYWKPYFEKKGVDLNSVRVYEESENPVLFNSYRKDNNVLLSNLYNTRVTYNGMRFWGSEQLYLYLLTETQPQSREKLMTARGAAQAKAIMKDQPLDADAEHKKFNAMRIALRAKADSNVPFKTFLLSTGDRPLVEDASGWWDTFWGTVGKDGHYVGVNATGRLLMELRTQLQQEMRSKTASGI